jgi:hypothetical protein
MDFSAGFVGVSGAEDYGDKPIGKLVVRIYNRMWGIGSGNSSFSKQHTAPRYGRFQAWYAFDFARL